MQPENIHLTNPLRTGNDLRRLVNELLNAVSPNFKMMPAVSIWRISPPLRQRVASMETFSRLLCGVTPLLAGGSEPQQFSFYLVAIKNGTNPRHADYWGEVNPYDQRIVGDGCLRPAVALAVRLRWRISTSRRSPSLALVAAERGAGDPGQ